MLPRKKLLAQTNGTQKIHILIAKCADSIRERTSFKSAKQDGQGWTNIYVAISPLYGTSFARSSNKKRVPFFTVMQENTIDGFRAQALYQGLEARVGNNCNNPAVGKLLDTVQSKIQRTLQVIDRTGHKLLNRIASNSGVFAPILQ